MKIIFEMTDEEAKILAEQFLLASEQAHDIKENKKELFFERLWIETLSMITKEKHESI